MSYTQFSKPYVNGWQNNESGATPITAEILNTNYDAYLLGLNTWAGEVNLALAGIPTKVSDLSNDLNFSAVSFTQIQSTGTKIGTITVDGVSTDIYAPSGGGSGSSVSWNQLVSTGTKIATITIDGTDTDVYAPTSGGATAFASLSDVGISNPSNGQVPVYNGTTSKWENETLNLGDDVSFTQIQSIGTKIGTITINGVATDIYAPNGGGGSSWTDVTGTLAAGATSITLSDSSITTSSTIEVFDSLDVPYNTKTLSTGSITLTFDAQQTAMDVKVRVS